MKKCKHRHTGWWMWSGAGWNQIGQSAGPLPSGANPFDRVTCFDCGHWLPLGPANDSGEHAEAVSTEKDAARRAAFNHETNYRPGPDRFDYCPDTKSDTPCALCEALYLTSTIATTDAGGG